MNYFVNCFLLCDQLPWSTQRPRSLNGHHYTCTWVTHFAPRSRPTVTSYTSRKYHLQGRYIFRPLRWHGCEMQEVNFSVKLVLILTTRTFNGEILDSILLIHWSRTKTDRTEISPLRSRIQWRYLSLSPFSIDLINIVTYSIYEYYDIRYLFQ